MPSFVIHSVVAQKINKFFNLDEELFILGNIMPDCWRNTPAAMEGRNKSHFQPQGEDSTPEDYEAFYNKYSNHMDNPIYMGYLIHLMTDIYWRKYILPEYIIKVNDKECLRLRDGNLVMDCNVGRFCDREARKLTFELLTKNAVFGFPEVTDVSQIENFECDIEELDLSGLPNTLRYANKVIDESYPEKSIVFDPNHLEHQINQMVIAIYKKVKELQSRELNNRGR